MENDKEEKQKVFLIDDDDLLLDMYATKFKKEGFEVEIAREGEEALSKIKAGLRPSIVLLDVLMQKMDGFEFLEALKKENLLGNLKIVILSNRGSKEDLERGKRLGIKDYVVKAEFTPSQVVEKIKTII